MKNTKTKWFVCDLSEADRIVKKFKGKVIPFGVSYGSSSKGNLRIEYLD